MLLVEHVSTLDAPPALQVFSGDLNDPAIAIAPTVPTLQQAISKARQPGPVPGDHRGGRE
jgi:hypothetical protein